jgi:hypothetical protein
MLNTLPQENQRRITWLDNSPEHKVSKYLHGPTVTVKKGIRLSGSYWSGMPF